MMFAYFYLISLCRYSIRRSESSVLSLIIPFKVKINVAIYRTKKWDQKLQKMGFGYQHFHPKNNPDPLKVKKNILKYRVS